MKYIDEYRDKKKIKKVADEITRISGKKKMTLMEVCGTHTMSIFRYGLKKLLPSNINLISGPGCPVCVSPNSFMDAAVAYSKHEDIIICSFGDMFRVPGSTSSLEKQRARGGNIRVVSSPIDALDVARENPESKIVFLAVGFETTTPAVAVTIKEAKRQGLKNFYCLSGPKVIPPAIRVLLEQKECNIDGFLLPGHVSTIIGIHPYEFTVKEFGIGGAIAGFEPLDVLEAVYMLVSQIKKKSPQIQIQYKRVARPEGNPIARKSVDEVFEIDDSDWRGVGVIPKSGLKIRSKFKEFDAEVNLKIKPEATKEAKGCICGEILCGVKTPKDCKLFGKACTPSDPKGACMVSTEGTCAAWWKYNG